jgi:hypothetical protein
MVGEKPGKLKARNAQCKALWLAGGILSSVRLSEGRLADWT